MYDESQKLGDDFKNNLTTTSNTKNNKITSQEVLKLPYIALVVGLLITVGATYMVYKTAISKEKLRFSGKISEIEEVLKSKLTSYETLLKATKGFIEINENTDRQKFADFVKSINLEKDYGGVQGIGYSVRVPYEKRKNFIAKMREEGISNFKIFPNQSKNQYQAVIYLEPRDVPNKRAIGFDMSSEKIRQEAMSKARDSGDFSISGKVTLLQETDKDKQKGFLIYLPIYEMKEVPKSFEERSSKLKGYVYSPFRAGDFLNDIMNSITGKEVGVLIYDGEVSPENLLAQSQPDLINIKAEFETVQDTHFGGRQWKLVYKSLPVLPNNKGLRNSTLVLFIGLFLSALIFLITYLEASSRLRYQLIAENLAQTEKERTLLLESEQNARREVEETIKVKDRFISNVSHELRTPLNAISGWTRILKGEQITPHTKQRAFKTIEKNIQTQSKLIEELLDLSQIATKKEEVHMSEVDFSAAFEKSVEMTKINAEEKHIDLRHKNLLNGEKMKGSQKNIEKVFNNILQNAVKFTPKQGVVEASIKSENDQIEFTVKDNGKGIKKEYLPNLFDDFSQEDSSSTRKYGGFGLGLTYSRYVIRHHGGDLKINSEGEDKGTTLTINFPFYINNHN